MKVKDCLGNIDSVPINEIHIILYVSGGKADEWLLANCTSRELLDMLEKECSAYYQSAGVWYLIVRA